MNKMQRLVSDYMTEALEDADDPFLSESWSVLEGLVMGALAEAGEAKTSPIRRRFTKDDIRVGSYIMCDNGMKYTVLVVGKGSTSVRLGEHELTPGEPVDLSKDFTYHDVSNKLILEIIKY